MACTEKLGGLDLSDQSVLHFLDGKAQPAFAHACTSLITLSQQYFTVAVPRFLPFKDTEVKMFLVLSHPPPSHQSHGGYQSCRAFIVYFRTLIVVNVILVGGEHFLCQQLIYY